jgi:glycine cleavage system H lipoate-binding protein
VNAYGNLVDAPSKEMAMEVTGRNKKTNKHSNACVWMKAGVVRQKFCKIAYNCLECTFDRALRRVALENRRLKKAGKRPGGKKGDIVFWEDRIKNLPPAKQPCLHYMKGRIDFRSCTSEYRCGSCEFDQCFLDQYAVHATVQPVDVLEIDGFKIPQGYYFHRGHTWVKLEEGSEVCIGLDDFALKLFGPLDGIVSPLFGKEIVEGQRDISITRGSESAGLCSPVSGVVVESNGRLRGGKEAVNIDPYSDGWVVRVHATNLREDLKKLIIGHETEDFIKRESDRLYEVMEEATGPLAADGGYPANDIIGKIPGLEWKRLAGLFLGSDSSGK